MKLTLLLFLGLAALTITTKGQNCVQIQNLPDTINACSNTTVQLNPVIATPGQLTTLETTWAPTAGLSSPSVINPIVSVGTTSGMYTLTVTALTPGNLVVNGDFSSLYSGFSSGYTVGTGGSFGQLSNAAQYAVTTDPNLVHNLFSSFGDHTSGSGEMMVVNGASTANVDVWCQTIAVVPNTYYDFSTWIATAYAQSPAILQFSINGALLGVPFTAPAGTGIWSQFHEVWFSGFNTSATICITNQNTAQAGNDFALDDIEFRQVCIVSDSVYFNVTNLGIIVDTSIRLGCLADTVDFVASNLGDPAATYAWDFGDGTSDTVANPSHIFGSQGNYNVTLIATLNGCSDTAAVVINTMHLINADFNLSADSICTGQPVQLVSTASSPLSLSYLWDLGDGNSTNGQSVAHIYSSAGLYTIRHVVNDVIPCFDTIEKQVYVSPLPDVSIALSDSTICEGEGIIVSAVTNTPAMSYTWDFGTGTRPGEQSILHAFDTSGTVNIILSVDYSVCPGVTVSRSVDVFPYPRVDLGPDTSICPFGEAIRLSNTFADPADAYFWSTGETTSAIDVRHHARYWVAVRSPMGCTTTDSIEVLKSCYINIPNVFSPNNDGINDHFFPRQLLSANLSGFSMKIFNRWGQLIYETNRIDGRGWDGKFNEKPQPQGVYVYLIEAVIGNKYPESYQGNITLLR